MKFSGIDKVKKEPLIVLMVIAGCFLYLLNASWLRWGDMRIDTFKESLVALNMLDGKALYRDIFYEYGFFPPYLLALFFKVFGAHVNTLVLIGIANTALMSLLLYKISRFFLDAALSGMVVLTFLSVFAFGFYCYNGIFNFILPYSTASVFLVLFAASSLFFFLRFIDSGDKRHLFLWSAAMTFAFFSRVETAALLWAGFFIVSLAHIFSARRSEPRHIACLFMPLFFTAVAYCALLFGTGSAGAFLESTVKLMRVTHNNVFVLHNMGLTAPIPNLWLIAKSILINSVYFIVFTSGYYFIYRSFIAREKTRLGLMLGIALLLGAFLSAKYLLAGNAQFRFLPVATMLFAAALFIKTIGARRDNKKDLKLLALFTVASCLATRVLLNATPNSYGFYILPIGIICYFVILGDLIGRPLLKKTGYFNDAVLSAALISFFLITDISWWQVSNYYYGKRDCSVGTERGRLTLWNDDITKKCVEAIAYLRANCRKDDGVIVIPYGVGINFFSQQKNPLLYFGIFPQIFDICGDKKIIDDFKKADSEYIIILAMDTSEHGPATFGVDYGVKLDSWIRENYHVADQIGPYPFSSREFGIAIYKKNQGEKIER